MKVFPSKALHKIRTSFGYNTRTTFGFSSKSRSVLSDDFYELNVLLSVGTKYRLQLFTQVKTEAGFARHAQNVLIFAL